MTAPHLYPTRNAMIADLVPRGEVYGEIGVFKGEFAKVLLEKLAPRELVLFDLFEGRMGSGDVDGNFYHEVNLTEEYARLQTELPAHVISFRKGDSSTNLRGFADNYFTMVYIDGDHSYDGCKKDLEVAFAKVKADGWIMGHDYQMNMEKARTRYHFGVKQAVDEFCVAHGLSVHALGMDGCVSYAIRVQKN